MASTSIGNSGVPNFTVENLSSSPKEFYLEYAGKKYKITMNNIGNSELDTTKQKVAKVAAAYIAIISVNTPDFKRLVINSDGATDPNKTNNPTCTHEHSLTSFDSLYSSINSQKNIDSFIDPFKNSRWSDDLSSIDKKVFEDNDDSVNTQSNLSQKVKDLVKDIFDPPETNPIVALPAIPALPAQRLTNFKPHTSGNVVPAATNSLVNQNNQLNAVTSEDDFDDDESVRSFSNSTKDTDSEVANIEIEEISEEEENEYLEANDKDDKVEESNITVESEEENNMSETNQAGIFSSFTSAVSSGYRAFGSFLSVVKPNPSDS